MSYLSRIELQPYMLQSGDNWILSLVHNRPHNLLSDNSDLLYQSMLNLGGKLGLNLYQKKFDGFPIYHGTHYLRTGMTFTEALSTLDDEVYKLGQYYRVVLESLAYEQAIDWVLQKSDKSILIISDSRATPEPIKFTDLGAFFWINYRGPSSTGLIYIAKDIEGQFIQDSRTISTIVGKEMALETYSTVDLEVISDTYARADLFCAGSNETGETGYQWYIKRSAGTFTPSSASMSFNTENNPDLVVPYYDPQISRYIRYMVPVHVGTDTRFYLLMDTNNNQTASYLLDKSSRMISTNNIICFTFNSTTNSYSMATPYIEGLGGSPLSALSFMEIRPILRGHYGMILADDQGRILFRESSDGLHWYPTTGADDGIVYTPTAEDNIDYPTFIPINNGYVVVFNSDYLYGTQSPIAWMFSRNGVNWEVPTHTLDLEGIFPYLYQTKNGNIYLFYWDEHGINRQKLFLTTERNIRLGV